MESGASAGKEKHCPVKLKRASTSTSPFSSIANNAAAFAFASNGCLANRHAQMPRHPSKTLEPVIIRPRNKSHQHGPTNCLSPNTKTLATSGHPEEREDANSHVLPGHGRGGGTSLGPISMCFLLAERALLPGSPSLDTTGDRHWRLTLFPTVCYSGSQD